MEVLPFYDTRRDRNMMEGLRTFLSPMERQKIQERVLHKHQYDRDRQYHVENTTILQNRMLRKTNSLNDLDSFTHYWNGQASSRRNSRTYEQIHSENIESARADSVASRVSNSNSYYETHINRRNSQDSNSTYSRISSSKESVTSSKNFKDKGQFDQEKYNMMRGFKRNVYSDPNFMRAQEVDTHRSVSQTSRESQIPSKNHRRVSSYSEGMQNERIYVTMDEDSDIIAINRMANKQEKRTKQNTQRLEKSSQDTTPRNTPPRGKDSKQTPAESNIRQPLNQTVVKQDRQLVRGLRDPQEALGPRTTPPKTDKSFSQSSSSQTKAERNVRNKETDAQVVKNTTPKPEKVVFQSTPINPTKRTSKPSERQVAHQQQQSQESSRSEKTAMQKNNEKSKPEWYSRVSNSNNNNSNTLDSQTSPTKDKIKSGKNTGKIISYSTNGNKHKDLQPIIKKTTPVNSEPKSSSLKKTNSFKVVGNSNNYFGYFSKEEEALRVKKKVTFSNEDEERPETA